MSSFLFALSVDAVNDIDQAVNYYNGLSDGLGYEFADTIHRYFSKLQQLPTASAIRYDQVRVKPVDTFPFTIHYTVTDSQIIILRVFNTFQRIVG